MSLRATWQNAEAKTLSSKPIRNHFADHDERKWDKTGSVQIALSIRRGMIIGWLRLCNTAPGELSNPTLKWCRWWVRDVIRLVLRPWKHRPLDMGDWLAKTPCRLAAKKWTRYAILGHLVACRLSEVVLEIRTEPACMLSPPKCKQLWLWIQNLEEKRMFFFPGHLTRFVDSSWRLCY